MDVICYPIPNISSVHRYLTSYFPTTYSLSLSTLTRIAFPRLHISAVTFTTIIKNWIEDSWDFSSEWIFFHLELLAKRDQDKNTIFLSFLFEVTSELNIVMELITSDVSLNISRLLADIRKALVSSGCLPSEIGIRVRSQDKGVRWQSGQTTWMAHDCELFF